MLVSSLLLCTLFTWGWTHLTGFHLIRSKCGAHHMVHLLHLFYLIPLNSTFNQCYLFALCSAGMEMLKNIWAFCFVFNVLHFLFLYVSKHFFKPAQWMPHTCVYAVTMVTEKINFSFVLHMDLLFFYQTLQIVFRKNLNYTTAIHTVNNFAFNFLNFRFMCAVFCKVSKRNLHDEKRRTIASSVRGEKS